MSNSITHKPAETGRFQLKEERYNFILEALRTGGKVVASELSGLLGVSEDTVRRDLRDLAREHLLMRVHGGALPRSPSSPSFVVRRQQSMDAKRRIARVAAGLLQNGQLILVDGGTTTQQIAQYLPRDLEATIVTNNLPLAMALAAHPCLEVIQLGGKVLKESQVTIGSMALDELRSFRADLCLLGAGSVHPEYGIRTPEMDEIFIKRSMIEASAEVAALVSSEKLGTALPYLVAPVRALTHLVSDASQEILAPYREMG
ncbi:MAG TPA: DeoR/GlpR family DNA-binding transcription regulator, partial [Bryobacteraceae bacterium]|nr:DeoR/GlpR family DNA-binding transcription regulator [Bryobacteraceae bacterium]